MSLTSEQKVRAKAITDLLYDAFGSGTGYLFGISPEWRSSVEAIVGLTIQQLEVDKKEE